jgi:hypothetical protein
MSVELDVSWYIFFTENHNFRNLDTWTIISCIYKYNSRVLLTLWMMLFQSRHKLKVSKRIIMYLNLIPIEFPSADLRSMLIHNSQQQSVTGLFTVSDISPFRFILSFSNFLNSMSTQYQMVWFWKNPTHVHDCWMQMCRLQKQARKVNCNLGFRRFIKCVKVK